MDTPRSHNRIRILTIACLAMMGLFVVRLFYMQIIQHKFYVAKAQEEQVKSLTIPAKRGEIYAVDSDGTPVKMVLNETVYTAFVDPVEVTEPTKIVDAVRSVAGGTVSDEIEALVKAKPSRYKIVAKNVTRKQAELLKAKNLRGLGFQETTRRVYPEAKLASQVLGFVNAEGKGQYGVEEAMNSQLSGTDGKLEAVTDISNVPLTIGNRNTEIPAKNGENIVLSIDRNVQSYTEKALAEGMKKVGAQNASALVMDPETGKILAMANFPNYNPEQYNKVQDAQAFNNAIITTPYEPGSVMKTFTVAAGIDKGVIKPDSTYNNTDYIKVDDRTITNASKGQTGTITIQHALNWSLNTGMVTVAQRLGDGKNITYGARETMYNYFYNRFGLGQLTNVQLSGEAKGELISPNQPDGNAVRYSNMSFGQGMNPTMLQVAAGFSSIINGGNYYQPTVIAGSVDDDGQYTPAATPKPLRRTVSESTSTQVRKMVHDARSAFYAGNDKKGYDIGGKTGTSQTLVNGVYTDDQTVGTYLGYGGDSHPKYVIMIQMSAKGKNIGGQDPIPTFTNISNWMIDYKQLQPNT